jgi:hypothetical protein
VLCISLLVSIIVVVGFLMNYVLVNFTFYLSIFSRDLYLYFYFSDEKNKVTKHYITTEKHVRGSCHRVHGSRRVAGSLDALSQFGMATNYGVLCLDPHLE